MKVIRTSTGIVKFINLGGLALLDKEEFVENYGGFCWYTRKKVEKMEVGQLNIYLVQCIKTFTGILRQMCQFSTNVRWT